ncbi:MAG: MFS transporter [Chloroflexi bacterium]|nr:MFS transporter [Chloroflexota bacterium]
MTLSSTDRLPLKNKVAYGVGDFGFSLTGTLFSVYLLIFLTDVVGLRPALAGLVIFVTRQCDWINDPIIGHISDRTHTKWGRRRPFLLFGFIPFGILFALLWWKAPIEQQALLALYYAGIIMVDDIVATLNYMPYYALTPELTHDYDERTSLTAYRMAFSIIAGLVAFIVPPMIVGSFRPENADRVFLNGALFAAISALTLLVTFLGTKETPSATVELQPTLRDSLRAAIKNKPFLFSIGIYVSTFSAMDIVSGVLLYYIRYYLGRENIGSIMFAAVFVTALIFLPFWTWISSRTSKRLAYIFGIAFWAVVQVILVLVTPNLATGLVIGLGCLAGIGISAAHVLPWSIIPDAVEWDELQTGQRHEGMFYSLVMLAQKAASGLAMFLVGIMLDVSGYVANAAVQTPKALLAIRNVTGLVPAILLIVGILFAIFYPISREEYSRIRAEIEARRATQQPDATK